MANDQRPSQTSNQLGPEVREVLARYVDIQAEMNRLRAEKSELQEKLRQHLAGLPGKFSYPEVNGVRLKVAHIPTTTVEYDEELLVERLGDRYPGILKPDLRKIRAHLDQVAPHLEPVLTLVGTPDRGRVQEALRSGVVRAEEFAGAFRKTSTVKIAVMRARDPQPDPAGASPF